MSLENPSVPRPMLRELPSQERPRERLQLLGAQALSTTELLAITLKTGSQNESALHLAEQLIVTFGDLPSLAQAAIQELTTIKGIGLVKATEIKAALELGRRLHHSSYAERLQITSPATAANYLMPDMAFLEQEHLRLILMDTRNRVLSSPTIFVGSLNSAVVRLADLFRAAIKENAASLIAAHNHPSGDPSPSPEDIHVTRELVRAGHLLGIEVLDHVIIGRQRYVSLKERGLGFDV
ncbi:MAG: DNA repair protein RadC [Anaerolineales bacterium]|nr:DNA repair protein RadC [Anaerolineales bacterium]